ncbi:iron oxidase oxidoreductase [Sulfuricurvum sp.]|uniref:iron oxidase oxidoreductase n=1 Tax=Sulfuricurvum sp. TaxID=2025608 RepID=UPI0025EC166F|nr:iron oxidase oxidoreductase [Sulfuricurvum sp.]
MSTALSRRSFFKHMLAIGTVTFLASPLQAKVTKIAVKYQVKSTTGKKCKECLHFLAATNECKLVEGKINPEGSCTLYLKDPKKPKSN